MTMIKTRVRVAPDGTLSGRAAGLPAGEHDAEIALLDTGDEHELARPDAAELLARIRTIQTEIARLPMLDARTPEEIVGYNERGHFD